MALVIYDLDDTLLNEDCSRLWIQFLVDQAIANDDLLEQERILDQRYREGNLDMNEYLRMQLSPHIGKTVNQATEHIDLFLNEYVAPHFRKAAIENIRHHQQQGDRCIVVSASVEFLVKPIARKLGIYDAIGVEIETQNQLITGYSQGTICYQEGKVSRLQDWLKGHNESLEGSWFYSDSHNDLPLLNVVDHPVAVSPDERLRETAIDNGWALVEWREAKGQTA